MKRKLVTYLPIAVLAVGLALGMAAALMAIPFTASPGAEAATSQGLTDVSGAKAVRNVNERLTGAVLATSVASGSITASPADPGRVARITVIFRAITALNPGQQIILTFEDDFQVTVPLNPALITVSSTLVTGGGAANQTVKPDGVSVSLVGPENDEAEVQITLPDLDPSDFSGGNGIAATGVVTVIFQQGSGIKNPSEAGNYDLRIRTSTDVDNLLLDGADGIDDGLDLPVRIEMNTDGDPRGTKMTMLALGVEGSTTATFWRDADGDGVRDANERDLCNVVTASDDTATCTYTIANPPFTPGTGTDCLLAAPSPVPPLGPLDNCNFINVRDGESIRNNASATLAARTTGFPQALTQAMVDRQKFELEPTIDVQPRSLSTGDRATISLFDFTPGTTVTQIILGGVNVTPIGLSQTIAANGEKNFTFTIPGVGPDGCVGTACQRIPTGVQRMELFASNNANQDINITIGGAKVTSSHKNIIANQDLTISVSGFTERGSTGADICIPESGSTIGGVTLNNVALEIDEEDNCDIAGVNGVELTGGGTGTFTVIVREFPVGGSFPTSLLTPGEVELKIIDTSGSEGTLLVTIPDRTITVTPASSRPRDSITVKGTFFIADNPDGSDATVNIVYDCGGGETRSTTADPDVSGTFTEVMSIPSDCTIPSTNTITASISVGGTPTGVVETVTHNIPEAVVTLPVAKGKSGDKITLVGDGFRTFDSVEKIDIGGRGTLGGRTVNTDARGAFTVTDIIIPGLDPGIHAVIVEVGTDTDRTTASTTFEVLSDVVSPPGTTPTAPIAIGTALTTPLGVDFVRAFHFNNQTKVWSFSDPRPEFTPINTLKEVNGGQVYWINVANDKSITFCGRSITLYKGWNQTPC